ncbi:MAG TPA: hypothetical protein VLF63_00455, partial [Patescibacteria group bacterium]|nr:hypothetical protein [Patescibacteria group bacterium]
MPKIQDKIINSLFKLKILIVIVFFAIFGSVYLLLARAATPGTILIFAYDTSTGKPLSGVTITYDNTTSTGGCYYGWGNGTFGQPAVTGSNGETNISCTQVYTNPGYVAIKSITLSGFTVSSSSYIQAGSQLPMYQNTSTYYDAGHGIKMTPN